MDILSHATYKAKRHVTFWTSFVWVSHTHFSSLTVTEQLRRKTFLESPEAWFSLGWQGKWQKISGLQPTPFSWAQKAGGINLTFFEALFWKQHFGTIFSSAPKEEVVCILCNSGSWICGPYVASFSFPGGAEKKSSSMHSVELKGNWAQQVCLT